MTDTFIIKVCLSFALTYYTDIGQRQTVNNTCRAVAYEAKRQDVAPSKAIALAWAESGFLPDVTSKVGAKGPMQVMPKWWCKPYREKGKPCDYIESGVRALKAFERLFPKSFVDTVCHYNSGVDEKCPEKSLRFAGFVDSLRQKVAKGKIK